MNILLINPRLKNWSPNVYVPLGLTYIAAVLEPLGHAVSIVDLNVKGTSDSTLRKEIAKAGIVGLTGLITEYPEIIKLSEMTKQLNDKATIIVGGPLAATVPQELSRIPQVDFVVIGEGERTIVSLIDAITNKGDFQNIKGIVFRGEDGEPITTGRVERIKNLDTIPLPAHHLLNMERYIQNHFKRFLNIDTAEFGKVRSTNMVTSRGCIYHCTFCFKNVWGYEWLGRSPENIVAEIEELQSSYGINGFFFDDEIFHLDKERVFAFARLVEQKKLKIIWHCNGRANIVTKELLEAMYSAGCRNIIYGIESGNQRVLDSMRKGLTISQVRDAIRWTKQAGISADGYFMFGLPGETKREIEDTLSFARELDLDVCAFSIATPFVGTELYDTALREGLIHKEQTDLKDMSSYVNANLTQDCSDNDLLAFLGSTFREFYLEKRFGRFYFLHPRFLLEVVKVLRALRNWKQVRELIHRGVSIITTYVHSRWSSNR